jgi:hypothetical protein
MLYLNVDGKEASVRHTMLRVVRRVGYVAAARSSRRRRRRRVNTE